MKTKINLKDPKFRVPILLCLVGVGMIALWYYYVYAPNIEKINGLEKKVSAKQDTLRTIQALKPQLNMLREELRLAENKLDSLKSIFPDQKEIPRLLREITSVARASGITTTKFNPMPDIEKEYYVENHYNMAVSGGYHQLAEFFAFLANFTLIINLSSMNITTNPEYNNALVQMGAVEEGKETIVSQFEMTTFSSKK
jgi:type IV pilus assembly protein PilO